MTGHVTVPLIYADRFLFLEEVLRREGIDLAQSSVLDLGARSMQIHKRFKPREYLGIDFDEAMTSHPLMRHFDLEQDLDLGRRYDFVMALDVLEHLESFHRKLEQMREHARLGLIIALPNMYHYLYRARFLMGLRLGTKYDLGLERSADRHRWLFTPREALALIGSKFPESAFSVTAYGQRGSYRGLLARSIDMALPLPSLAKANTLFFVIKRQSVDGDK
jgi:hypothetical protein